MNRRLTVETSYSSDGEVVAESLDMRHLKPAYHHPKVADLPDPELSPFANQEVLLGNVGGPAVEVEIVEKYPTICIVCGVDFKLRSNLHAHLTAHEHLMGKLDNYLKVPVYECKHCVAEVNASTVLRHRCFLKHKEDIEKVERQMDTVGSPLVCVFCRGRVLPSRSHLIAHLIATHSPHRNPFRCIFCHTQFRSDSLLMQEMHVFDHHVPELEFINRLAYFKAVKTMQGGNVEATTPFLCLYDGRRMEQSRWWETLRAAMKAAKESGAQDTEKTEAIRELPTVTGFCAQTFNTLAEFTTHLYCQHTFVAQGLDAESVLTDEELKKLDKALKRIPGPTVRQMMSGPPSGDSAAAGHGGSKAKKTSKIVLGKSTCKVCLQTYEDESALKTHWTTYHIPENTKRVQHLTDTGELTNILKIDLLCTECFNMFPTVYQLQVHIMVAHSGKTWCRCGTCNQEFCEDDKTLPANLTIGKDEPSEEENQNSNPQQPPEQPATTTEAEATADGETAQAGGDSTSKLVEESMEPYAATLPILTLCRMLETHEGRHCEQLRPPKRILFLPTKLLQQILYSCGQQAAQVATWLNEAFMQPAHLEVKPFRYEDPNDTKKNKRASRLDPGVDPLTSDGLECAVASLQGLMERVGKSLDADEEGVGEGQEAPSRVAGAGGAPEAGGAAEPTSATATGGTSATTQHTGKEKNKLPSKLAKLFAQLGERNAIAQAEIEFNETL